MTKKEFKYDMQRGLGSCIVELMRTPDINQYRDIILWGCNHELAYDAQCEGTRSWYLYQRIWMYEDWNPFFEAVCSGMKRCSTRSGWEFMQHAELCALMAGEGYAPAGQALNDMYTYLLEQLMQRKRRPKSGAFPERENMEALCIAKVAYQYEDKKDLEMEYIRIVHDLGRLFQQKEGLYSFDDFPWFQAACEGDIGEAGIQRLLNAYAGEKEVAIYRKSMETGKHKLYSESEKKYPAAAEEIHELEIEQEELENNFILKAEYDSILNEIEKQKEGSLGSVFRVQSSNKEKFWKFITGSLVSIALAISCLFIKLEKRWQKIVEVLFFMLIGTVLGYVSMIIPIVITPKFNYFLMPLLQLTLFGLLVTYSNKKEKN